MSIFGLPIFRLPAALIGRRDVPILEIPVDPVIYVQHAITMNRYVGCVIITNSISGYGYDLLLPLMSGRNCYSVFSGKVGGSYTDYDCANTLLRAVNLNLRQSTPYIELTDPATGNPYKIFVMYIPRCDLRHLNSSLKYSIASHDYTYFTRFPLDLISRHQSCQSIRNDAGVDCYLNAIAASVVSRIHANIDRYV